MTIDYGLKKLPTTDYQLPTKENYQLNINTNTTKMALHKETLEIDTYLAQLLAEQDKTDQKGTMQEICSWIESLPMAKQQACIQQLQLSIRKDFDEILTELEEL